MFGIATKALISNEKGDKFLILHKSNLEDINPNQVDIPGGRLEFGEDPYNSLHREVFEETGFSVEVLRPTRVWGFTKNRLHLVGITFLCQKKSGQLKLSHEHTRAEWFSSSEILKNKNFPKWLKDEVRAT